MSDAIRDMVAFLIQSPGWKQDRMSASGPNFSHQSPKRDRIPPERNPPLKARILTERRKGKATSDEMAKRLRVPQQGVSGKLSRLYNRKGTRLNSRRCP